MLQLRPIDRSSVPKLTQIIVLEVILLLLFLFTKNSDVMETVKKTKYGSRMNNLSLFRSPSGASTLIGNA